MQKFKQIVKDEINTERYRMHLFLLVGALPYIVSQNLKRPFQRHPASQK
jgi:hypothetical protein